MNQKQKATEFWRLKQAIDIEAARLGWSTEDCKAYTQKHYGVKSRLLMSDEQLADLLGRLSNLNCSQITTKKLRPGKRKKKKRRD